MSKNCYDKVDNQHITYDDNRITTVLEDTGPVIYRDGKLDMVLFLGGYATVSGNAVTFHYYTQDYLGNNRAVINGTTGLLEQAVAYYPYGGVIADLGTNATTGQPYKFGGKELITVNGLNEYDFGARQYYSAVPGFTKPDPMCEKYYWLSPYLYCGNNPVNFVDPSGMIWNDPEEAEQLKNDINKKISSYQNQVNKLNENISNGKGGSKLEAQISDLNQRIELLQKGLLDIDLLGMIRNIPIRYPTSMVQEPIR